MGVPVHSSDIVVFCGDSITAAPNVWFQPAVDSINANFPTVNKPQPAMAMGVAAKATGVAGVTSPVSFTPAITVINSGIGGNKAADIAADVTNRITQYNPTILVLEIGVNDCTGGTTIGGFRTSVDSIFSQTLAAQPACKLFGISPFLWHEQWGAGPVWANAFDPPRVPSIDDFDASLMASVQAAGGTYVLSRSASLAYEVANNTPAPGAPTGILTIDGLHPNDNGRALWSSLFYAMLTVS